MTKLFLILKSFSTRELATFEQFLEDPLVNQREDVRKLLSYWRHSQSKFTKEKGFEWVYPERKLKIPTWHLLMSRLFKLAEQFLISNELKQDEVFQKILLAKAYRKKQIPGHFESTVKNTRKLLEKTPIQNTDWLHQKLTIEYEYYDYIASHNRKERTNLQMVNNLLDEYFITNKLRNACLSISRKTINGEKYEIYFLNEVLEKVEKLPILLEVPSIAIYYYCYRAITEEGSEIWFTKLRAAMADHSERFEPSEKRDIILLAINYCIRQLNTGNEYFIREAFELYRLSFSEDYLLEDKIIPESTFTNMVSLAAKLKEYQWAEDFVEANQKYLNPNFQEPLYFYSLGLLNYEQGRYEKSMQSLAKVDTKMTFLLLAAKALQIKIYVELKEMDVLENLLDSFRVFLQRRKDLGYRKENFENLVNFVRRWITIPYKNQEDKQRLIDDIKAANIFSEKDWLIKQVVK